MVDDRRGYNDMGGAWAEEMHETAAGVMLAMVILHVIGVTATSCSGKILSAR